MAVAQRELEILDREAKQPRARSPRSSPASSPGCSSTAGWWGGCPGCTSRPTTWPTRWPASAEKAYQFERGETNGSFIQPSYWESKRSGLLAAETPVPGPRPARAGLRQRRPPRPGDHQAGVAAGAGPDGAAGAAQRGPVRVRADRGAVRPRLPRPLPPPAPDGQRHLRHARTARSGSTRRSPSWTTRPCCRRTRRRSSSCSTRRARRRTRCAATGGPASRSRCRTSRRAGTTTACSSCATTTTATCRSRAPARCPGGGWTPAGYPAELLDVTVTVKYTAEQGGDTFATAVKGHAAALPVGPVPRRGHRVPRAEWTAFLDSDVAGPVPADHPGAPARHGRPPDHRHLRPLRPGRRRRGPVPAQRGQAARPRRRPAAAHPRASRPVAGRSSSRATRASSPTSA